MNQIPHCDWLPELSSPARDFSLGPEDQRSFFGVLSHVINKSYIDQACSVKMAGYWPRFLFACLWTSTSLYACQDAKMAATLVRALVFFIASINGLPFKDRHNALNGNLTCYSNCWTAKPVISHSFVLKMIDLKGVWFAGILEAWFI